MSEKTAYRSEIIARDERFLSLLSRHHRELKPVRKSTDPRLLETFYRRVNFELQMANRTDAAASRYPSIALIVSEVAAFYKISVNDIHSNRRTANIVLPRQIAAYLAKKLTLHSLPAIGRHIGGRDHTTILASVRKIESLIARDETMRDTIEILKAGIEARMGRKLEMVA